MESAKPMADWRVARASERLAVNPADSLPFRLVAWSFLLVSGFLMIAGQQTHRTFFGDLKVFIVLAVSQFVLIYLLTKSANDVFLETGLKRLKAKVPDETACPTAVQVMQDGSVTGADEGFLWVDEGTVYFKGLHSVWRLNRDDVKPLSEWPSGSRPRGRGIDRIVLSGPGIVKSLRIRLIDPFEDFATRRRAAKLQAALGRWLADRPEGSLESLVPPMALHPGLERGGVFRHEGVASGLVLVVINIVLLLTTRPEFARGSIVALQTAVQFAVVLTLIYFSVRFAWQQVLDQRVRRAL